MKLFVVPQNEKGKIVLTLQELENIIDRAYEEGKKDGSISVLDLRTNRTIDPSTTQNTNWKANYASSAIGRKSVGFTGDGRYGD